jgi:serine/threonine protein phosphatase 1
VPFVQRVARNERGRDFAVGDIHGCAKAVEEGLRRLNFDVSCDRLFCCGDLIDRGPESLEVLRWLESPWFFSIRGNHDQMMLEAKDNQAAWDNWVNQGGQWAIYHSDEALEGFRQRLAELPIAMEIETRLGRIGLLHADLGERSWPDVIAALEALEQQPDVGVHSITQCLDPNYDTFVQALWGRKLAKVVVREALGSPWTSPHPMVAGIDGVVLGHTPTPHDKPLHAGNVWLLDTGAGKQGHLSFLDLQTGRTMTVALRPSGEPV